MKTLGIVLIILGAIMLAYRGIRYTTDKKVIDAGPIEVNKEERHTFPFSPVLGGVALVGGIVMVAASKKKSVV